MMELAGCETDGNEEKDEFGGSAPKYRDLLHDAGIWKVKDLGNTDAQSLPIMVWILLKV